MKIFYAVLVLLHASAAVASFINYLKIGGSWIDLVFLVANIIFTYKRLEDLKNASKDQETK